MSHLSDNRPRAWSESDKNRTNSSLQNSRMNALKKLKMKLGRGGNQRKMKSDQGWLPWEQGLVGCCGNRDWFVAVETGIGLLNFNLAYVFVRDVLAGNNRSAKI